MGIRLIVEAMDSAPATLTHREWRLLVVLAEDANDETRTTWGSVASKKVLHRADLSRTQLYAVLKALVDKGALERVSAGQKNGTAKYKLMPQCPAPRDTEGKPQSPRNRDTGKPQRPVRRDTEGRFSVPETGTLNGAQCPVQRDVSVPSSGTPTPHPSIPTTSDAPKPTPVTAQTIVGEWLERVAKRPPKAVIGQVARHTDALLDEGIHPDDVRRGLARWMSKGLHPSTIPAVVNEVMNAAPPTARGANGRPRYTDPAERGIF